MRRLLLALAAVLSLGVPAPARAADAEDDEHRRAREEVEREVQKLVQEPEGAVKVTWTGFDSKEYEVDDAKMDLDGKPLAIDPISDLPHQADRVLFAGKLEDGTHHVHLMLLMHWSNLSLLGGYRVTQFRVNGDIPFPAARGLSVPVRIGLHIDPQSDDAKKKMAVVTDIKPVMLAAIDDSMPVPPPVIAPPTTVVAATEAAPPPLVAPPVVQVPEEEPAVDAGKEPKAEHTAASRPRTTASVTHEEHGGAPRLAAVEVDAGVVDAGPLEIDAGPPQVDAGPPVVDAGPPAPRVATAEPVTNVTVRELDESGWKRIAAAVAGLLILCIAVFLATRRRDPPNGAE